jgi:hypothetical protein
LKSSSGGGGGGVWSGEGGVVGWARRFVGRGLHSSTF